MLTTQLTGYVPADAPVLTTFTRERARKLAQNFRNKATHYNQLAWSLDDAAWNVRKALETGQLETIARAEETLARVVQRVDLMSSADK